MIRAKKTLQILIVEEDESFVHILAESLQTAGYSVITEVDGEKALEAVLSVDFMVTAMRLPGMGGLELLKKARELNPALQAIVITGTKSIQDAVTAMQSGARTYLAKPFPPEQLLKYISEFEEIKSLRFKALQGGNGGLVGISPVMQKIYSEIEIAASSDFPVLLTGETGTGKNVAAMAIHSQSFRRDHPFIPVDLGVIPPDLMESELFGHERGAFTGADRKKMGRFSEQREARFFLMNSKLSLTICNPSSSELLSRKKFSLSGQKGRTILMSVLSRLRTLTSRNSSMRRNSGKTCIIASMSL